MDWPFGSLRMFGYGVILLDPPWRFFNWSEKGEAKNPVAQYDCMTLDDLKALPVGHLAAPDCAMVMWGVAPMLDVAMDLMKHYGFTFKTSGGWAKQSSTGNKWQFGPGYIMRSAHEPFIVGTIGSPPILSKSERNLVVAPVREHSRKPDDMHRKCEALWRGPRVELFARQQRPGWDCWGNDTRKFERLDT